MCFIKPKKPDPKDYILHDFIYTVSRKGKTIQWLPRVKGKKQPLTIKGQHRRNLEADRSVLSRTVVVDTQLQAFVEIHTTADHKIYYFTLLKNFTVCKLKNIQKMAEKMEHKL